MTMKISCPPRGLLWLLFLVIAGLALFWWMMNRNAAVPRLFARQLPETCGQILLVVTPEERSIVGEMKLLERSDATQPWRLRGGPIPVTVGRNGLAWGRGEHTVAAPAGFRVKQEGDGCSPAGIFRLPFAFGYAASAADIRIPYQPVTKDLFGVDDVKSQYYNQVVDATAVTPDWDSRETMLREDGLYRWGAFVAHNPMHQAGAGSCIFLHLWSGPDKPTAGCTAMTEEDLQRVLRWLDPTKEPRLVQAVAGW